MVPVTVPVAAATTKTVASKWLATYTVRAAESTATPTGPAPTAMVPVTVPVASLITDTVLSPRLATYTVRAAESTATPNGSEPTAMVPVTVPGRIDHRHRVTNRRRRMRRRHQRHPPHRRRHHNSAPPTRGKPLTKLSDAAIAHPYAHNLYLSPLVPAPGGNGRAPPTGYYDVE